MDRKALLSASWSAAAALYAQELAPRFTPWAADAQARLLSAGPLPAGDILVPCCGPGHELLMLARDQRFVAPSGSSDAGSGAAHPAKRRHIIGIDLSEGMCSLANAAVAEAGLGGVAEARVGDASDLSAVPPGRLTAAILSVFGLQQMPAPAEVLAAWWRQLAPGGVAAVCYWPGKVEDAGPWQAFAEAVAEKQAEAGRPAPAGDDWDRDIPAAALRAGADLLYDTLLSHDISWPSPEACWHVMTCGGPWHARRLQHGDAHMDDLQRRWMRLGGFQAGKPLLHAPRARLVVLRKPVAACSCFGCCGGGIKCAL